MKLINFFTNYGKTDEDSLLSEKFHEQSDVAKRSSKSQKSKILHDDENCNRKIFKFSNLPPKSCPTK